MRLFDRYLRTGTISGYGDRPRRIWESVDGRRRNTGELRLDAQGRPQPGKISKTYAVEPLERMRPLIDKFGLDGAMDWLGTQHTWDEMVRALDLDPENLPDWMREHENLSRAGGGFGMFAIAGEKLGSYALNRWQESGTITKDMWWARTMARLTGEPVIIDGRAISQPWSIYDRAGLEKRRWADEAWNEIARETNSTPAAIQEAMWDVEHMLYNRMGASQSAKYVSEGTRHGIAKREKGNVLGELVSPARDGTDPDGGGVHGDAGPRGSEGPGGAGGTRSPEDGAGGPGSRAGDPRVGDPDGLAQRGRGGAVLGAVSFPPAQRPIVHLIAGRTDFSTLVHESAHVFRRTLSEGDQAIVARHFGEVTSRASEERFARAFERYLRDGRAPTRELRDVFRTMRAAMLDVYRRLRGTPIEERVHPEVRDVFDRMLGAESARRSGAR